MLSLQLNKLSILFSFFLAFWIPTSLQAQLSADFSSDDSSGCLTVVANFSDLSTGNPTSWNWFFVQNGAVVDTRTGQNPGKIFNTPGCFDVILAIADGMGNVDTVRKNCFIEVFRNPAVDFGVDTTIGCAPATFNFNNLTVPNAAGLSGCTWVLINQNTLATTSSTSLNPSITLPNLGRYDVQLRCTNTNGCDTTIRKNGFIEVFPSPTASFTVSDTIGCTLPVSVTLNNTSSPNGATGMTYNWAFPGGTPPTASGQNPAPVAYAAVGSYPIGLIAVSSSGCADSTGLIANVSLQTINAGFTINDTTPCTNLTVGFRDTTTYIGSGSATWDLGDNSPIASGTFVPKQYSHPGPYTIQMMVVDALGCTDTVTRQIQVQGRPPVNFGASPTTSCNISTVFNFGDSTGGIVSWLWDFGDNNTSTLQNPSHTYGASGNYTVCLTVTDTNGCDSTRCINNLISLGTPVTDFSVDTDRGCVPYNASFMDLSTSNDPIVSWMWTFDGGMGTNIVPGTSTAQNPSVSVDSAGFYDVTLVITTQSGCKDSITRTNYMRGGNIPMVDFTADADTVCIGETIQFTSLHLGANFSYFWDFNYPGGFVPLSFDPRYAYPDTGCFDVALRISDKGCQDTLVKQQVVCVFPPRAAFTATPTAICTLPATVTLTDNSLGPVDNYRWYFNGFLISTAPNPPALPIPIGTPAGSYPVKLVVENTVSGCMDSIETLIVVANPIADFSISDKDVCIGDRVDFANLSQNTSGYLWDFGDNVQRPGLINGSFIYTDTGYYSITLIAIDQATNCRDTLRKTDSVRVEGVFPSFTGIDSFGCAPLTVQFGDSSTSSRGGTITAWDWDFGDLINNSSALQHPIHTYVNNGQYSVTLTVTDSWGCVDSLVKPNYTIASLPQLDFSVDRDSTCLGNNSNFTNLSTGNGLIYQWRFGPLPTDTSFQVNPTWTFPDTGFHHVQLIAVDQFGCVDSLLRTNVVYIEKDSIEFDSDKRAGTCPPLSVQFSNLSVGNIDSVIWDFGDGTRSFDMNPGHIYSTPGCFDVQLIIFHPDGCSDTLFKPCYIDIAGPNGQLAFSPSTICINDTITFAVFTDSAATVILDPDDTPLQTFTFGQNTTDTVFFQHVYTTAGIFDPIVVVTDVRNCLRTLPADSAVRVLELPNPQMLPSAFSGCTPFTTLLNDNSTPGDTTVNSWTWIISTGDTLVAMDTSYTFTQAGIYDITLQVRDAFGCRNEITQQFESNPLPIADFVASDSFNCAPATITFTDRSTNTMVVDWKWYFGDGDSAISVNNPLHTYTADGTYDVTLIVFDINNCSDTLTKSQYIRLRHPSAHIYGPIMADCTPATLTLFADSSQIVSDTTLARYTWNLALPGGGSTTVTDLVGGTADNVTQTYGTPGFYQVELIVEDVFGCTDTLLDTVQAYNLPVAGFALSDSAGCRPLTVSFADTSLAGDTTLANWLWDFGTGDQAFTDTATYTFMNPGTYTVTLYVLDNHGCIDSVEKDITVHDIPVADFSASDTFNCSPIAITFSDNSSNTPIADWAWDFGDSGQATGTPNPVHNYTADGMFDVQLIVTDVNGCMDTLVKPQYIHLRHPTAFVYSNAPSGCNPVTLTFFADSSQILSDTTLVSYTWIPETHLGQRPPVTTTVDTFSQGYPQAGTYDVTLIVEDIFGCRDTMFRDDYVVINQTTVPDPIAIEYVSVLGSDSIEIVHEAFPVPSDLNQYIIYWENPLTNLFQPIDSTTNPNQLRYVHRTGSLNTEDQPHCYKVIAQNSCLQRASLRNTLEHCTVHLTATPSIDEIQLDWTPYQGWSPTLYQIYRVTDYDVSNITLLATVNGDQTSYVDTATFCDEPITYRVIAAQGMGSPIRSFSNIDTERPIHLKPSEVVDISFASVFEDTAIDIAWQPYTGYRPLTYLLEKSEDNIVWNFLDSLPITQLAYQDWAVKVNEQSYYYRMSVLDECGDIAPIGFHGKSILLTVELEGKYPILSWSAYEQWRNDVFAYQIEIFNDATQAWELVEQVGGTVNKFIDDLTTLNQATYCYRIRALEANGLRSTALSNEDCTIFGPNIFAPNAFSPNDDGTNDRFFIFGPNLRNVTLIIFNRWGRKIYETSNLDEGWDGTYNGVHVPEGVYVWHVSGTGVDGTSSKLTGTVTVIR